MRINRITLRIIQVVLGLVIAVGAFFAVWLMLSFNTDTTMAETRAQLTRLEASASVYYGRLQSYEGVCTDIGVPKGYRCHESDTAYAIEVPLKEGKYLCLDSQGFLAETIISKGENTFCRQY